jgi:phosphate/sulfate permease
LLAFKFLAVAALLAFASGWNTGPVVVGNMLLSGSVNYKRSLLLTAAGLMLGTSVGWPAMKRSLVGSVSLLSDAETVAVVFGVSFLIMVVFSLLRIPVSLSVVAVGSYLGASVALGFDVNGLKVATIIASWLLAPVLGAFVSVAVEGQLRRVYESLNLIAADAFNRVSIQVAGFVVAFALGTNNVGLILGTYSAFEGFNPFIFLLIAASAILGMVLLGKALAANIGERMVGLTPSGTLTAFLSSSAILLVSTALEVPMSVKMALIGSMIGVGVSKKFWIINKSFVGSTVASWFGVALFSAFVTYVLLL